MNYQESDPGLKKLQAILAESRAQVPKTDVESFLIELHRRQRAQLLRRQVDTGFFEKCVSFVKGFMTPAYGTAFACAAVAVCYVGIHSSEGFAFSGRVSSAATPSVASPTMAISPAGLEAAMARSRASSSSTTSSLTKFFSGTRFSKFAATAQSAELYIPKTLHDSPRFLLANSQVAYDARASF